MAISACWPDRYCTAVPTPQFRPATVFKLATAAAASGDCRDTRDKTTKAQALTLGTSRGALARMSASFEMRALLMGGVMFKGVSREKQMGILPQFLVLDLLGSPSSSHAANKISTRSACDPLSRAGNDRPSGQ